MNNIVEIITYEELIKKLKTYMDKKDLKLIDKYYEESKDIFKNMKRETGEDYIFHPIAVAYTLADLKMDPVTIGSALIHEAITLGKRTFDEIKDKFGEETAIILECISKISHLKRTFKKENNVERYRRITVGLAENPKALFIKFADRLHNMRTIYVKEDAHQKEIIDETMNILIPIAHRLGVKKIMSELEDLCLKFSHPEEYQDILNKINASREELENDLNSMKEELIELLESHKIKYEISSRVKSVRGIYNKLHNGKRWEDIYDLLGLRVIVNKIEECYLVIGLIHSKFKPIPKRFKDYIANPKGNMYQSLHTTVFGVNNRKYEVQVRTYEMHEIAESGVASHWSYKEKTNGKVKTTLEERLETFRTLIESKDIDNNLEFFKNINSELKAKEIYAFTPKGDVIELPYGSTPIDFAYKIHSEVGNATIGALANNKMVKLDYVIEDGDIIELNTRKGATPNKNWLKFVKTDQAKSRIRSYFYKKERDKNILLGREMLEEEISKRNLDFNELLTENNIGKLLNDFNLDNLEELYFNVCILKILPSTIINKLLPKKETELKTYDETKQDNDILVEGYPDIKTSFASCCNPVYGEEIVGYVTKGNGIKIHSLHCPNISNITERIVDVKWNDKHINKYKVLLNVFIISNTENITELINVASKDNVFIESFNLNNKLDSYYYEISLRVNNIDDLNKYINDLKAINYVLKVERVFN